MKLLKIIGGIFLVIVIASGIIGVISPGNSPLVNHQMNSISNKVAEDATEQYKIAERNNDHQQMYAQAAMASQAFLQAKDEENYKNGRILLMRLKSISWINNLAPFKGAEHFVPACCWVPTPIFKF